MKRRPARAASLDGPQPSPRNHMFGQFALLEPFGAVVDGVVLDGLVGVVVDGVVVVVAAVLEDDDPFDEEPVAAFAIATTLPAIAPVTSRLARVFRSLITSPPFLVV